MKKLLVVLVAGLFVGAAVADEMQVRTAEQVTYEDSRDAFYCQAYSSWFWTTNGSTPFESEQADDIPDDLVGSEVTQVIAAVCEWGSYWIDPSGVFLNIYDAECPPAMEPVMTYYFDWADLGAVMIYDDPGWQTVYEITMNLPETLVVTEAMSLGFVADLYWGQTAPYGGFVMTEDYMWYGDCEAWWDGTHWSSPRWTPISGYFGTSADVAYCLSGDEVPAEDTTWGSIKALYK
jgi:hypothetical protein